MGWHFREQRIMSSSILWAYCPKNICYFPLKITMKRKEIWTIVNTYMEKQNLGCDRLINRITFTCFLKVATIIRWVACGRLKEWKNFCYCISVKRLFQNHSTKLKLFCSYPYLAKGVYILFTSSWVPLMMPEINLRTEYGNPAPTFGRHYISVVDYQ